MYKIYKISEGDTLESIAKDNNTTIQKLLEINGIDENHKLIPNTYLIVPTVQEQLFDNYVVQKGDTVYEIAKRLGVDANQLLLLNGLSEYDYIYPEQVIIIPKSGTAFYITSEGNTLESAAKKMDTNVGALILQNENIYLLPGQLLVYKKNK